MSTKEQRACDSMYDPCWTTPATCASNEKMKSTSGDNTVARHHQVGEENVSAYRYKYFETPLGGHFTADSSYHLARTTAVVENSTNLIARNGDSLMESKFKSVAVQTEYRDSEAQTIPYSPNYLIRQDSTKQPEVLSLAKLTYGNGLPTTMKEVIKIEQDRKRKDIERRKISGEINLNVFKHLLEEHEKESFQMREKELDEEMETSLNQFRTDLLRRVCDKQNKTDDRLEVFHERKMKECNEKLARVQKQRIKVCRQVSKPHVPTGDPSRENVASGRTYQVTTTNNDPSCREISALLGKTKFADTAADTILSQPDESDLPYDIKNVPISRPKISGSGHSSTDRKSLALSGDLHLIDSIIKSNQISIENEKKDTTAISHVSTTSVAYELPPERPPTPRLPEEIICKKEEAIALLNRLSRGKVIQQRMLEEKENISAVVKERYSNLLKESIMINDSAT